LYFDSKEDVFKSLARESIGGAIADAVSVAKAFEGASAELLRVLLRHAGFLLRSSDRAVLPKIVLGESGNFPELLRFWRTEVVDKGLELFGFAVARGVTRGEFRAVEPQHAARLCIAPLLLAAIWRSTFDLEGLIETHIDVLLKGLSVDGKVLP